MDADSDQDDCMCRFGQKGVRLVSRRTSTASASLQKMLVSCGRRLVALPLTVNETLKRVAIFMQESRSFWW